MSEGLLLIAHLRNKSTPSGSLKRERPQKKLKRQIRWTSNSHYRCIRESQRVMRNIDEINEITEPREEDFCIYMNDRECASRDKDVPLYEAVYKCQDGTLVRVQINHLKAAYNAAGKKDSKRAWDVNDQDNIPYWVDRYAYSKIKN
jgi:hypothetical protein